MPHNLRAPAGDKRGHHVATGPQVIDEACFVKPTERSDQQNMHSLLIRLSLRANGNACRRPAAVGAGHEL